MVCLLFYNMHTCTSLFYCLRNTTTVWFIVVGCKLLHGIITIQYRTSQPCLNRATTVTKASKLDIGLSNRIVAAEEWLKQRRSHRGFSGQMDDVLEKLYYPCGRSGEASDVEVDNIENYGDVVEAMLLLGATPNIELMIITLITFMVKIMILLNTRNCTIME